MEPSVLTTTPTVECSRMTFSVPSRAAAENSILSSLHGVFTSRASPFSSAPSAPSTGKPTQSTMRTFMFSPPAVFRCAPRSGMNFGSAVITVLPLADCGSSSRARARASSSAMFGSTISSMNRLIKVDLPVRTGPTTPI